ncbi:DNA cytosine methyltransferase [Streptomyces noursei]|uniref:DNA cytosine methyltransferase n=1 Tax=Streptomyces noursei TaxID=1971 RepID=UPI0036D37E56
MSGLRIGSLCTGYGGLDMAAQSVFGGTVAWVADPDPGASLILAHHHPQVPNLGDLTAVDWAGVEPVDVLTAGYPCQPFSTAGHRKGVADDRHIWPHIAGALRVLRPRIVVLENVANHLRLGFDAVLADLARGGFDAWWCVVRASDVGAPHQRRRLVVLAVAADTDGSGLEGCGLRRAVAERRGPAADAADLGHQRGRSTRGRRPGPADRSVAAADADRGGFTEHGEAEGGRDAVRQWVRHDADRRQPAPPADWGVYGPAVARWEHLTGRPAPGPTDALGRLSPGFVEWMMGLPAGHVTDVPGLTRTQQLKALGNGVVPQQIEAALRFLAPTAVGAGRWEVAA